MILLDNMRNSHPTNITLAAKIIGTSSEKQGINTIHTANKNGLAYEVNCPKELAAEVTEFFSKLALKLNT